MICKNKCIIEFNKQSAWYWKDPYKDPYEDKYQLLINKREIPRLKHFNDPKSFIEYSNNM